MAAEEKVCKVCWRSTLTGALGESTTFMTLTDARIWRGEGNRSTPELEHWVIWVDRNGERVD